MLHHLLFRADCRLDLQAHGRQRLERVRVRAGEVIEAKVRPYIHETEDGPVEMADLHLGDEAVLLGVPMARFQFVDRA
jgi:hypothetical protein